MGTTTLRIENGILLSRYSLPFSPSSPFSPPAGWLPDDLDPWVQRRAAEIAAADDQLTPDSPLVTGRASVEFIAHRNKLRLPCPGWLPVTREPAISRAYRRAFLRYNGVDPEKPGGELRAKLAVKHSRAEWLPDGLYEFRNNELFPKNVVQ